MAKYAPEPRKYELMIVVSPTVGEEGLPAVIERVSGYVTDKGGAIESESHENPWGRRRLAYPIQNHQDAFYVLYYFTVEPRFIDELERDIRLEEIIIRHLIVRYDPMTERVIKPEKPGRAERQAAEQSDRPARAVRQPAAQTAVAEQPAPAESEPAETVASTEGQPAEEAQPDSEETEAK
ncbi:MAG: 30S ribosomal protein S6 [Chloroflexia bacterium]|nr:30S ribosomal protein S6 [Chloroflexia bacterium]